MKKKSDIYLLAFSIAGFTVFYIAPFVRSLGYAFVENAFTKRFAGFSNFASLFKNEYFLLALKNTLIFTCASVPLVMIFSLAVSLFTVRYAGDMPFVKGAFFLPVLLPSATIVALFSQYSDKIPPFAALLIIFLWKYSGLDIMLMMTALSSLDKGMLEAAKIDGAGVFRRVFRVMIPNILPVLFFTLILSTVNSLKIYRESYLLYGEYPDRSVYMLQNYLNNHFEKLNYQNISTAAIIFAAALYIIVGLLLRVERKRSEEIW